MPTVLLLFTTMPALKLSELAPSQRASVVVIHAEEALHQRLLALGFRSGKVLEVVRKAPFSGPIQVRLGTTDIVLRRSEAAKITVCRA